jgi:type I restriction enzyme M protein
MGEADERKDEFMGALAALGGSAGNGRLRSILEWDEDTYEAVRSELVNTGLVSPGRGRGGSVSLNDGSNGDQTATSSKPPSRRARTPREATTASSFDQAFRAIDDCLRKEAGCGTELDYTEQTSWLLFLKYLDGLEDDRAAMALLEGRSYTPILEEPYRWNSWAAPKNADGQLDHNAALTGDDLRDFCESTAVPLPGAVQAACQRSQHD